MLRDERTDWGVVRVQVKLGFKKLFRSFSLSFQRSDFFGFFREWFSKFWPPFQPNKPQVPKANLGEILSLLSKSGHYLIILLKDALNCVKMMGPLISQPCFCNLYHYCISNVTVTKLSNNFQFINKYQRKCIHLGFNFTMLRFWSQPWIKLNELVTCTNATFLQALIILKYQLFELISFLSISYFYNNKSCAGSCHPENTYHDSCSSII